MKLNFVPNCIVFFDTKKDDEEPYPYDIWGQKSLFDMGEIYFRNQVKDHKKCFMFIKSGTLETQIIDIE